MDVMDAVDMLRVIFKTEDEAQACRVLAGLRGRKIEAEFEFKDGWYEIHVRGELTARQASELNGFAVTIANSSLKPMHLGSFKQCP